MKTIKHLTKIILGCALFTLISFSCTQEEPNKPTPPEPPIEGCEDTTYNIAIRNNSDLFKISAPTQAVVNEEIDITITEIQEGVNIEAVKFNESEAEFVSNEDGTIIYSFVMPEEDVTISVENTCDITLLEGEHFSVVADKEKAGKNETVTLIFTVSTPYYKMTSATFNEEQCTFVEQQGNDFTYTFTMPDEPVTVTGSAHSDELIIERSWDEHCVVVMLDCINNQGTPEEYCSQVFGEIVHFIEKHDLGYDVKLTVTGIETGTDYSSGIFWSLAEDSHLYQDSWAFYMPDESVMINATSTEKGDYLGEPFIGEYIGSLISVGTNNIYNTSEHKMTLNLRASSAYSFVTTDEKGFDTEGLYTYSQNKFDYIAESCTTDWGVRGEILDNEFVFAEVHYLIYDNWENISYYFGAREPFEYTCAASDQYGIYYLLEATQESGTRHFYVDIQRKTIKEVTLDFEYGDSINGYCLAKVSDETAPLFMYSYSSDSTPVFQFKGKEEGTYTSATLGTLYLDGFGKGTYNNTPGNYTLSGTIVKFNDGTNVSEFNIDLNNKTFSIIENTSGWNGASQYSLNGAKIYLSGSVSNNGVVTVTLDKNLMGNDKEGYAAIQIQYPGSFGRLSDIISDCQPYYYESETHTLVITNVLQGTGNGYSTTRKDIRLKVQSDFSSMTFEAEYIYSTSTPYEYLFGGNENIISAVY